MKNRLIHLALVALLSLSAATAQQADTAKSLGDTTKAAVKEKRPLRTDAAMEKWRDNRFGVFVHWGIFSMPGGVVDGKVVPGAAEWIWTSFANKGKKAEYEAQAKTFNPTEYDPKAWARLFKEAGARYVVFVTKHHDGFCLWDSKLTDYDAAGSAYGKDLIKPLVDACRAEGIDIGLYYSIIDWHHPGYTAKELKTEEQKAAFRTYMDYMKGQLKELLTEFGDVKVLWFDGRWDASYKQNPQYGIEVEDWCRSIKKDIIINDRVRAYDSFSDYDASYERRLPDPKQVLDLDWEACMTMPERTWGYHSQPDGAGWKTPRKIIGQLAECSSRGGNFLLNVGPTPQGTIRSEEQDRLKAVGAWMKNHSNAIVGTRPANLELSPKTRETGDGIFATRTGDTLHLVVTRWPDTDRIFLPGLDRKIVSATLRAPEGAVKLKNGVETDDKGVSKVFLEGLPLTLPGCEPAAVIDVQLEPAAK